ncbi:hypothetical protein BDZ94DRAFT_652744 [Collybia nuda]|uniref:Uncharacterized protein n=1 Tax=Collybia nuda TaxID=64659 RepID=A0A9P5Y7D7_9AGAR|nr:hypothetical protein BDZ94DRAFT_652744 [Collybia nuda]
MWDQFRLFVGLLSNTPIWNRTDKPVQDNDSDSDDEEELEQEESAANVINANLEREPRKFTPRPRARPPYAMYGEDPIPVGSDAEVKDLLDEESTRKEEKVITFLNDPEDCIKVFLSSYMRKQGLIWHKPNLSNMPRLVGFFVRFLIRNRTFPESAHERDFRRCLEIIDRAQNDLPLTAQIATSLPDDFNESCKTCWGTKADGYKPLANKPEDPDAEADESVNMDEPKSKKARLDDDSDKPDPTVSAKTAIDKFEEELKAANVEVIKLDEDTIMKEAVLESILDNVDDIEVTASNDNSWGGWGSSNDDPSSFATKLEEPDPWAEVIANWGPSKVQTLTAFLGPTALPLTHTAGVVEWSVRRVKSLAPPPHPNTVQKSPVSNEEDADAVDIELERQLAKVVLEPWLGWDKAGDEMPHLSKPRILESSRGPIISTNDDVAVDPNAQDTTPSAVSVDKMKPHDPTKDDITILVEPKVLEALSVGLGIGATWVQMAREQDFAEEAKKKKKKKSKSKKVPQRYWYVEEVILVLPSYHT